MKAITGSIAVAMAVLGGAIVLSGCAQDELASNSAPSSTIYQSGSGSISSLAESTKTQTTVASVARSVTNKVSNTVSAPFSSTPKGGDTGFDLTATSGSNSFDIPVSDDSSYMDAAAKAMDRCGKSGKKPTAPQQRKIDGKTVLSYSCS